MNIFGMSEPVAAARNSVTGSRPSTRGGSRGEALCAASNGAVSCVHLSGIQLRPPSKSAGTSVQARTKLSVECSGQLPRSYGRSTPTRTLPQSSNAIRARRGATSLASFPCPMWRSERSTTSCLGLKTEIQSSARLVRALFRSGESEAQVTAFCSRAEAFQTPRT